jgi:hypothetical protein
MLDFVVCALVLIVPLLLWSLWLVKVQRRYRTHKRLQLLLGAVLLVAVSAFEIDMRMHGGWQQILAQQQLDPAALETKAAVVAPWLYTHLVFAVTTPVLWIVTIVLAIRRFGRDPRPGSHSKLHKLLGWAATIDIALTSATGLLFYFVAFVR